MPTDGTPRSLLITVQHLRYGGMEKIVAELGCGLASRGHRVHVVGMYDGGPFEAPLRAAGATVHCRLAAHKLDPRAPLRLARLCAGERFDAAVAATGGAFHAPFVTLLACGTAQVPVVRWVHGTPVAPLSGARAWVERAMQHRNVAVAALTTAQAGVLSETWGVPRDQLRVVPIGQRLPTRATSSERDAVRAELGIGRDRFVVGLVAAFRKVKRHELLVHAATKVVAAVPALHLLFVGDGPLRAEVERAVAAAGLDQRVTFTGARDDANRLYAAMDLHALCSYPAETFPLCMTEALAAGVPCLATRVGGVAELLREGEIGVLVEPESATEIASAISALALDPAERARLAERGCAEAVRRFSLDAMVDAFLALVDDVRGQA